MAMQRIRFANQLRGLAALGVICSHLIGIYWYVSDIVSLVSASPAPPAPPEGLPGVIWLVSNPWINPGVFGVAIFFLISGFVIPFSIERYTRAGFLIARLLRIMPTYLVGLLLGIGAVALSAHAWRRPLPFDLATVAGNAGLVYDWLGQSSIDLVNWTLSVELKFYLLVALIAPAIRGADVRALLAVAGIVLALNAAMAAGWLGPVSAMSSWPSFTVSSQSLCLVFMLLGTAFNFHLRGRLGTARLLLTILVMSLAFVATWRLSVWRAQFPAVTASYALALLVFALLYALRRRVPGNPVLDLLAAVSFPLYLVHTLLGFVVLRAAMMGLHLSYYAALTLALAVVIAAAMIVHVAVERPTQALGRRLAASVRYDARAPVAQT